MGDALQHHGILGMKWGVRRTPEQLNRAAARKKLSSADKDVKTQRKQISAARRHLSDGDLKKVIDRLQTEKKLRELTNEDVAPGKTVVSNVLKQIGKASITAAGTAVATYAIKAAMKGEFDISEAAQFIRPKK